MISNTQDFWDSAWQRYAARYVAAVARQAYYLYFLMNRRDRTCLEMGAGSFRDTATLNKWGYSCIGSDFSEKSLLAARENYGRWADRFVLADAVSLPFQGKTFDVSFHNGLLVCFRDDAIVGRILAEQARVTKRLAVSTVHNGANAALVRCFGDRAKNDSLYDIRFFRKEDLVSLMEEHFDDVEALPFGVPWLDRLMKIVRNRGVLKRLYRFALRGPWLRDCERIMVVGRSRSGTSTFGEGAASKLGEARE